MTKAAKPSRGRISLPQSPGLDIVNSGIEINGKLMLPEFAYSLHERFDRAGIPLLLAGGWAVAHHGHSRLTLDVDWVCPRSREREAEELLGQLGFSRTTEGMAARFTRCADPAFPFVDLIWVDDATFEKMVDPGAPLAGHRIPVISFRALLAMKLFALKDHERRDGKDLLDLRALLRYGHHDLTETELQELCARYAGPGSYETLRLSP